MHCKKLNNLKIISCMSQLWHCQQERMVAMGNSFSMRNSASVIWLVSQEIHNLSSCSLFLFFFFQTLFSLRFINLSVVSKAAVSPSKFSLTRTVTYHNSFLISVCHGGGIKSFRLGITGHLYSWGLQWGKLCITKTFPSMCVWVCFLSYKTEASWNSVSDAILLYALQANCHSVICITGTCPKPLISIMNGITFGGVSILPHFLL